MTLAPFGRVDGAANSRQTGTGLGLPLAKRFVEILGGEIEIRSRFGQGTEVTIRLPRGVPEGAPKGVPKGTPKGTPKGSQGEPTAAKRAAA